MFRSCNLPPLPFTNGFVQIPPLLPPRIGPMATPNVQYMKHVLINRSHLFFVVLMDFTRIWLIEYWLWFWHSLLVWEESRANLRKCDILSVETEMRRGKQRVDVWIINLKCIIMVALFENYWIMYVYVILIENCRPAYYCDHVSICRRDVVFPLQLVENWLPSGVLRFRVFSCMTPPPTTVKY